MISSSNLNQSKKQPSQQKITINNKNEDLYQELVNNTIYFPEISKREQLLKFEPPKSKLPNITDILNQKKSIMSDTQKKALVEVADYARNLESQIRLQSKEIEKLQFLNNFLTISSQKKEEIIETSRKTIIELKDYIQKLEQQIQNAPPQIVYTESHSLKNSFHQPSNNRSLSKEKQKPKDTIKEKEKFTIKEKPAMEKIVLKIEEDPKPKSHSQSQCLLAVNDKSTFNEVKRKSSCLQLGLEFTNDQQFKSNNIMNLNMTEDEAVRNFKNYEHFNYLDNLIRDEEKFMDTIQRATPNIITQLYDKLKKTLADFKLFYSAIIRLKKIIKSGFRITSSLVLCDVLDKMSDEISQCLECDKTNVFVFDHLKNELWSISSRQPNQIEKCPINVGLPGFVATNKEILNIMNAYSDDRFNKQSDIQQGYKTKAILLVPILDESKKCLGVVQCINKLNGSHFSKEDESLLEMMANFGKVVLLNATSYDEQYITINKYRQVINSAISLSACANYQQLLPEAEKFIRLLIHADKVQIYLNDFKGQIFRFNEQGEELRAETKGIVGEAMQQRRVINANNCLDHSKYSPEIDIETQLPVITIPVLHKKAKHPLGVIQIANIKGLWTLLSQQSQGLQGIDLEVIRNFVYLLSQKIYVMETVIYNLTIEPADQLDENFTEIL